MSIHYVAGLAKHLKEGYDVTTVPDSTQILSSDANGNITSFPNLLNDLQKQINDLKTQAGTISSSQISTLNTQVSTLTTQINNIVNGTTPLQNTRVTGTLTTDTLTVMSTNTTLIGDTLGAGVSMVVSYTGAGTSPANKTNSVEQYLKSTPNGKYRTYFQSDGDLVTYDTTTNPWTTKWKLSTSVVYPGATTYSTTSFVVGGILKLSMQTDGNLVLYNQGGVAVWTSGSQGKGGNRVLLQESDGLLVLYNPAGTAYSWTSRGS